MAFGLGFLSSPVTVYAYEEPQIALEPQVVATVVSVLEEPEIIVSEEERCNCYLFVKNNVEGLPLMANITPNTELEVGAVAIFKYPSGLKHVAIVREIWDGEFLVEETNYKNCKYGKRIVSEVDKSLIGFWKVL